MVKRIVASPAEKFAMNVTSVHSGRTVTGGFSVNLLNRNASSAAVARYRTKDALDGVRNIYRSPTRDYHCFSDALVHGPGPKGFTSESAVFVALADLSAIGGCEKIACSCDTGVF